jgi:hypothetical protein
MEVRSSTGEWQRLASVGAIDAEPSSVEPPSEPGGTAAPAPERFRAVRAADGYELDLGPRWSGATSIRWPVLSLTLGARGNVPASTLTVARRRSMDCVASRSLWMPTEAAIRRARISSASGFVPSGGQELAP